VRKRKVGKEMWGPRGREEENSGKGLAYEAKEAAFYGSFFITYSLEAEKTGDTGS